MIYNKNELENQLNKYKNPNDKVSRMIKKGALHYIIRGLYTDDENEDRELISSRILAPSYISFEYALSKYQLIPEDAKVLTLATCDKRKKKIYETDFGTYIYYDVPRDIFRYGMILIEKKNGKYFFATKEKALLDMLYKEKPLRSIKNLKEYLFDNMRIDKKDFYDLNKNDLLFLIDRYNSTNCELLKKIIVR